MKTHLIKLYLKTFKKKQLFWLLQTKSKTMCLHIENCACFFLSLFSPFSHIGLSQTFCWEPGRVQCIFIIFSQVTCSTYFLTSMVLINGPYGRFMRLEQLRSSHRTLGCPGDNETRLAGGAVSDHDAFDQFLPGEFVVHG